MAVELKVPEVGESITEVQIAQWRKGVGERAEKDENLVEIESDKATVELPAPVSGTITQILKQPGQRAHVGEVIGYMTEGSEVASASAPANRAQARAAATDGRPSAGHDPSQPTGGHEPSQPPRIMPSAQRLMAEHGVRPESVSPTGPGDRILKEDAQRAVAMRNANPA